MKGNIKKTMDKLKIDYPIRSLIKQLWKHNYKTVYSCSGHTNRSQKYLVITEGFGDGWFDKNFRSYCFEKVNNSYCCSETLIKTPDANFCACCSSGFNGLVTYMGKSVLLLK